MTNLNEEFRIIENFPQNKINCSGTIINNRGMIRLPYDRYLKTGVRHRQTIGFNKNGKYYSTTVHKLVMAAFGTECPGKGYTIDHKDRNPFNNHISNLRWATWDMQAINRTNPLTKSRLHNKAIKLSVEDLDNLYTLLKVTSLDFVSKKSGITTRNLRVIFKFMHPLYN